jgi:putative membrane protein
MPHGHMSGQYLWGMWVGMAVFWISLLVFGVWVVNRLSRRSGGGHARRILEERYARGEIDEQEFRARSETLAGFR